ncbi:MAG TPA: phosphatase PAP2 family protein [Caulobacteraceae bacterium]
MAVIHPNPTLPARVLVAMRRVEGRLLLMALAASGLVWAFASLWDAVEDQHTGAFDRMVLMALRLPGHPNLLAGPRWLQECARDMTALGGFTVLTLISLATVAVLMMKRRRLQASIFAATVVAGQGLAQLVKAIANRPRPDIVAHFDLVYSSSFPSGHSTMAPVVYLTLAVILAASEPRRDVRVLIFLIAAGLVVAVGVSRVYLGVHWPTDVLAGWSLGAAIALVAMTALRLTARKPQQDG